MNALQEITWYQLTTNLLILKAAFNQVIREIASEIMPEIWFQKETLEALQEACELVLVNKFESMYFLLFLLNYAINKIIN